ncbi:MAG: DUF2760 domain-containing protein [Chloroflexota bacterium]
MTDKTRSVLAIFVITTVSMLIFSVLIPGLAAQPGPILSAIFLGAGLVLSAILAVAVSSLSKGQREEGGAVREGIRPGAAPPAETAPFDKSVVDILTLLQKKGRLIDFLQEDLSGYDDRQVGAAVRNIHKGCGEAIAEHVRIAPVMWETEGHDVIVSEGFDPSAIRLTGNVVGSPPFKGVVRHAGWRVVSTRIPPRPLHHDTSIIEPAEVEIL